MSAYARSSVSFRPSSDITKGNGGGIQRFSQRQRRGRSNDSLSNDRNRNGDRNERNDRSQRGESRERSGSRRSNTRNDRNNDPTTNDSSYTNSGYNQKPFNNNPNDDEYTQEFTTAAHPLGKSIQTTDNLAFSQITMSQGSTGSFFSLRSKTAGRSGDGEGRANSSREGRSNSREGRSEREEHNAALTRWNRKRELAERAGTKNGARFSQEESIQQPTPPVRNGVERFSQENRRDKRARIQGGVNSGGVNGGRVSKIDSAKLGLTTKHSSTLTNNNALSNVMMPPPTRRYTAYPPSGLTGLSSLRSNSLVSRSSRVSSLIMQAGKQGILTPLRRWKGLTGGGDGRLTNGGDEPSPLERKESQPSPLERPRTATTRKDVPSPLERRPASAGGFLETRYKMSKQSQELSKSSQQDPKAGFTQQEKAGFTQSQELLSQDTKHQEFSQGTNQDAQEEEEVECSMPLRATFRLSDNKNEEEDDDATKTSVSTYDPNPPSSVNAENVKTSSKSKRLSQQGESQQSQESIAEERDDGQQLAQDNVNMEQMQALLAQIQSAISDLDESTTNMHQQQVKLDESKRLLEEQHDELAKAKELLVEQRESAKQEIDEMKNELEGMKSGILKEKKLLDGHSVQVKTELEGMKNDLDGIKCEILKERELLDEQRAIAKRELEEMRSELVREQEVMDEARQAVMRELEERKNEMVQEQEALAEQVHNANEMAKEQEALSSQRRDMLDLKAYMEQISADFKTTSKEEYDTLTQLVQDSKEDAMAQLQEFVDESKARIEVCGKIETEALESESQAAVVKLRELVDGAKSDVEGVQAECREVKSSVEEAKADLFKFIATVKDEFNSQAWNAKTQAQAAANHVHSQTSQSIHGSKSIAQTDTKQEVVEVASPMADKENTKPTENNSPQLHKSVTNSDESTASESNDTDKNSFNEGYDDNSLLNNSSLAPAPLKRTTSVQIKSTQATSSSSFSAPSSTRLGLSISTTPSSKKATPRIQNSYVGRKKQSIQVPTAEKNSRKTTTGNATQPFSSNEFDFSVEKECRTMDASATSASKKINSSSSSKTKTSIQINSLKIKSSKKRSFSAISTTSKKVPTPRRSKRLREAARVEQKKALEASLSQDSAVKSRQVTPKDDFDVALPPARSRSSGKTSSPVVCFDTAIPEDKSPPSNDTDDAHTFLGKSVVVNTSHNQDLNLDGCESIVQKDIGPLAVPWGSRSARKGKSYSARKRDRKPLFETISSIFDFKF